MSSRGAAAKLTVLATAFILVACGGGGGGDGSSAKKSYIEQADARCKATAGRVQGLLGLALVDQAQYVRQALPALEALAADLHALPAPPGDQQLATILAEFDRQVARAQAIVAADDAGDEVLVQRALSEVEVQDERFSKLAADYGFKECGQQ